MLLVSNNALSIKEKYQLYESSVQCDESDIDFINSKYQEIYKRPPLTLREDFSGTGLLACNWTKQSHAHKAWAIDLDQEPMNYGLETHFAKLSANEQTRMNYVRGDVLDDHPFKVDVIAAFNFSYYIFKERSKLVYYFSKVRESLSNQGIFVIDLFGGTDSLGPREEETEYEKYSYFWDCDKYNPITHECLYYIHFKKHSDGIKHTKIFTYDWRLWAMAELRDALLDAGFKKAIPFWEGDGKDGGGNGHFYITENADNCESWVTYLVAVP